MEKTDLHLDVPNKSDEDFGSQNMISRNLKVLKETLSIWTALTWMQLGIVSSIQAKTEGDPLKKAAQNIKEKKQREKESVAYQKKTFNSVDRRDIYRNIIVLKHNTKNNTYMMKRITPSNAWNTEWQTITLQQFENPNLLRKDFKVTGLAEHILIVDGKVKNIDYKKAKKFLDQKKIKEKQDTMKKTEWQPQNNKPQNNKPQEKKELPPVKWVVKNKFFQV